MWYTDQLCWQSAIWRHSPCHYNTCSMVTALYLFFMIRIHLQETEENIMSLINWRKSSKILVQPISRSVASFKLSWATLTTVVYRIMAGFMLRSTQASCLQSIGNKISRFNFPFGWNFYQFLDHRFEWGVVPMLLEELKLV